jgi:serine/threonine protein kinase
VLCGLQAAHAAGVLHRDLKPDNVLLRYPSPHEPHAVITDFGLARAFRAGQRHVTASCTLVGSAGYLAPEQVAEAPLTAASDVYSFGVVLFELLTGQQPFQGETPLGLALKRLHVQPPRPSRLLPSLGERYDAFVLRCLARDPKQRFQSAAEARAALQALSDAPKTRGGARRTFSVLGAACAMSLWVSAEHDFACTRVVQPLAGSELEQTARSPTTTVGPLVASQTTAEPLSGSRAELPLTAAEPSRSPTARAQRSGAGDVAAVGGASLRSEAACTARLSDHVARSSCSPRAEGLSRPALRSLRLTAAAAQPGVADVLTPEGFLDPFAD